MGNKELGAVFCQSLRDFPCPVTLGKRAPSFGLHRYKQGLRFVPLDDEGFAIRGDKQRLIYKGRRRSHRFTLLGDTAFEYDCILEKEPDSNVISLRMEGAENFDFLRQPDFICEPFLAGSYAVYKKETLLGEGTGKLCHIHRPQIIDASGRRCWGDLSVINNELRITIPERWLSEAKYPVVVDPTIGTATVGSQYLWDADPPLPFAPLLFEVQVPVNRFLVTDTINGNCTAYIYTNADDGDAGGCPVFYSDNNNKPLTKKSANEEFINLRVRNGMLAGWRSGSFRSNGSISSGAYLWFGVVANVWYARFDYGAKCYCEEWDYENIPNTYPIVDPNCYQNFRLSMYFTYSSGQNYVRTITQGVSLTDNRSITAEYKRISTQTVQADTAIKKLQAMYRNIQEVIKCLDSVFSPVLFFRKIYEAVNVNDNLKQLREIFIGLFEILNTNSNAKSGRVYFVNITDTVYTAGVLFRTLFLFVKIITKFFISDYILNRFLIAKAELKIKSCIVRDIVIESRIK